MAEILKPYLNGGDNFNEVETIYIKKTNSLQPQYYYIIYNEKEFYELKERYKTFLQYEPVTYRGINYLKIYYDKETNYISAKFSIIERGKALSKMTELNLNKEYNFIVKSTKKKDIAINSVIVFLFFLIIFYGSYILLK